MVFETTVGLGIALLLAPAIAEYAKMRSKADRGFSWLALAGVLLIFGGLPALGGAAISGLESLAVVAIIFQVLGWIVALIGTIFVGYEVLVEK